MSEPVEKVEVEIVDGPEAAASKLLKDGLHSVGASLLLRAVLMVLMGLLLVVNPGGSIAVLTMVIGIALLIVGGIGVAASLSSAFSRFAIFSARGMRNMALFNSAAIALLGIISLIYPAKVNIFWMLMIGLWQLITGFQSLFGGARSPFVWSSGLLSIVIGAVLVAAPWTSLLTAVWLLGTLLIAAGIWIGYAGFRLQRF